MSEKPVFFKAAPEVVGLADILGAVSREIIRLGQVADDLQENLSPFVTGFRQENGMIESLQMLDHLSQHLNGVADFLNAIAPTLPAEWSGDAAAASRGITLSSLAQRLSCPDRDPHFEEHGNGALEFF